MHKGGNIMKYKILALSLIAGLLVSSQAQAVSIKGKAISTITDILSHARGLDNVSSEDTHLEIEKFSLMRLLDNGQLNLLYNIGSRDNDLSLGGIKAYPLDSEKFGEGGFITALARTTFNNNKIIIASSRNMFEANSDLDLFLDSNRLYYLYFIAVNNDSDGKISQSRFGAWRYPKQIHGTDSGYIKDIKAGIFVEGFDGELVMTSTMEVTNDNSIRAVKFTDKKVTAKFDFWALFADESGDVKYKKLDNLTQIKDGFTAGALNGIANVSDGDWTKVNNLDATTASPYISIKTAAGDFNNDGYNNEIAVMTADRGGINLFVYQITYENNNFVIRTMKDLGRINSYSNETAFNGCFNGSSIMIGGDIVTGDFDGDGETEFIALFKADPAPQTYYTAFKAIKYKWNNNKGDFDTVVFEHNFPVSYKHLVPIDNTIGYEQSSSGLWGGLKAAVLDIDGDGTDEIAFTGYEWEQVDRGIATKMYLNQKFETLFEWKATLVYKARPCVMLLKTNTGNFSYIFRGDFIVNKTFTISGSDMAREYEKGNYSYNIQNYMLSPFAQGSSIRALVDRELAIAAGSFFGQFGLVKECDDLAIRTHDGEIIIFKSNGSNFEQAYTFDSGGNLELIAADFAHEGVELDKPERIITENDRSYTTVLQGIPYHVDTIAADGKTVTADPVNFSYTKGSKVEYSTSSSESDKKNTKFNMSSTVETIFALDSDVTRNVVGGLKTITNLYGTIKTIAGIIPGTDSYVKAVDKTAGNVLNFLNKLTDKVENIKQGYDNEIEDKEVFQSTFSDRFDVISYVYANQYTWRYPILNTGAYFGTVSKDFKYLTKQDFVTFSMYDDTNTDHFSNNIAYQPTHENGNLFSYPAAVANIENYNSRQADLSEIIGVQFGIPMTMGFTKIKSSEHEETSSTKVTTGYISQAASLVDSLFSTNIAKVPEASTGPTFTKKTSSQEKFVINLVNADGARLLGNYRIQAQAFIADNGALTCGFAVNQFNEYADLFNSSSLYRNFPDPSFVLPNKFVLKNTTPLIPEFGANTAREIAMEMRGVRIYAADFNMFTTNRLLQDARYRIDIPLYNASFKPANNVKVDLYWVQDRTEAALANKTFIASTTVNMAGWSDSENNKTWARFNFTPSNIPANKAGEHYQFYAIIDPDNNINEVHEKRDLTKDSGGNNEGYFEFSVEAGASAMTTKAAINAVRLAASNNDFELPDITYNGYKKWSDFYDAEIANSEGPVYLDVVITNKTSYTLPDTELKAAYIDPEIWQNEQRIPSTVFGQSFTLFPNEIYKFSVVIDDAFASEMRRVGNKNTFCTYTMFWLDDVLSPDNILTPDSDPELEIYNSDSTPESEDVIIYYCDTVITENYTLSSDTALYWRINDAAELIYSSESASNDVYTLPVVVTSKDFNIVVNPEDSAAVMTDKFDVTISTIPNVTPAANYSFTVEISEDGENWEIYDFLTLKAGSQNNNDTIINYAGSGGGGCNLGFSLFVSSLILAALFIRRKA